MKKKSIIAVLLIVALAFSLAACGGGDSEENTSGDSEKVTYKVGTEPTFPPFDTTDEEQNIVGLDMDLIKDVYKRQVWSSTAISEICIFSMRFSLPDCWSPWKLSWNCFAA